MNYDKIAENVIASAVKTHLRTELKQHCSAVAKQKAKTWLQKNKASIATAIGVAVDKRLNAEKKVIIKKAAAAIGLKAPVRSRRYY